MVAPQVLNEMHLSRKLGFTRHHKARGSGFTGCHCACEEGKPKVWGNSNHKVLVETPVLTCPAPPPPLLLLLPIRQREDFLYCTVVVESGCSELYSDNDLVLLSKDDPYVSVGQSVAQRIKEGWRLVLQSCREGRVNGLF